MKSNPNNPENWNHNKNILVIMAHPDDPEFFAGRQLPAGVRLITR